MTDTPLYLSPIASPLADEKLADKLLKLTKKAAKAKFLKRGVKEVVKGIRKGDKGLVILAGNVSPIDVITHIPVMCEEADIPYIYVPAKAALGEAASTKRPTSVVMVTVKGEFKYQDKYDSVVAAVKKRAPAV